MIKLKREYLGYLFIVLTLLCVEYIRENKTTIPTPIEVCIEEETVCEVEPIILPTNFDVIYKSFKSYNPYLDTVSAIKFTEVANHFGLTKNKETLRWAIGQILLESGAKQYWQPTHPKEGELLVSSAGAIGFTQILPSTAYGYMVKELSEEDKDCFIALGATDFSFAYDKSCTKKESVAIAKGWLTDETNNMIMWGKIMGSELETKTLIDALIAYNAGGRGLYNYLNAGNEQKDHKYIIGIKTRFKYVDV